MSAGPTRIEAVFFENLAAAVNALQRAVGFHGLRLTLL
jgi:hypothetical protein